MKAQFYILESESFFEGVTGVSWFKYHISNILPEETAVP
jgi:hypothetical protein